MSKSADNHVEVELRALAKDLNLLKRKIKKTSAKYIGSSFLHDIYFCNKAFNSVEEAEMNEVGSYSVRLRKFSKEKMKSTTLNIKVITNKGDHHAWEEHETEVEDFFETAKILSLTEFKPFFELKKTRYEYKLDNLGIFIEDIENFGGGIEVEILTQPGKEEEAKTKIMNFLNKIGVSDNDVVPKSITNIVMKQRAFRAKIDL